MEIFILLFIVLLVDFIIILWYNKYIRYREKIIFTM